MAELKTFPIPIDLNLIEKTNSAILELFNIAKEERYSEDSVIEKIKEVNRNLYSINNLPHGFFKDYKMEFREWRDKIEEKKKPFNNYMDLIKSIPNIKNDDVDLEEKMDLLKEICDKLDSNGFNDALKGAFEFDMQKVVVLQSKWLFIKLSWQRRFIHIFTNFIFRFRFLLLKFFSGFMSFLITTIAAFILGLAFMQYSDFIISFIVFVISFFTLDRMIDKNSDKIFWRIIRTQTLILYKQLNIYTSQLAAITQFMNTEKEI